MLLLAALFLSFFTAGVPCMRWQRWCILYEMADHHNYCQFVTSDIIDLPPCSGINVRPSVRLPSCLVRPTRSLITGMPAEVTARAMTSLIAWCLVVLLGACLQTKPCNPCASATAPHLQVCAIQTLAYLLTYLLSSGLDIAVDLRQQAALFVHIAGTSPTHQQSRGRGSLVRNEIIIMANRSLGSDI